MKFMMSLLRSRSGPILLALGVLLAGCRSNAAPRSGDDKPKVTTISVENQGFLDMTVYVLVNGQRNRLGIAPGNKTTELTVPSYLVATATELRFVCEPIGGKRTPVSEEVTVYPGDQLVMVVSPGG